MEADEIGLDACGHIASASHFLETADYQLLLRWHHDCCHISAITPTFITVALVSAAHGFVLHRRGAMAAMIKAHPGLKPLEEDDSEMSELIAQEQRRQACARRPKPKERGGERAESGRVDAPSSL